MIELSTPEEIAAAQAELWAQFHAMAGPAEPDANLENAQHLFDPEVLQFRCFAYRVPPLSYEDGIRLLNLAQGRTDPAGHRRLVDFMWDLARPRPAGRWARFRARLSPLPNPFRRASPAEVGALLHFFRLAQTRSTVRYRSQPDHSPVLIGLN